MRVTGNKRKKLLILTPRYPYPVIGGDRLRIYYLCRELAQSFSLTLLSMCDCREELESPLPDDGVFDRIERVYLPKWRSYLNVILALPTSIPLQVAYYRNKYFASRLQLLLPEHEAVLAHLIRTGDYVQNVAKPRILEMTDAISLNYCRLKQSSVNKSLKSYVYTLEADRLLRYEKNILTKFDLVSLVSDTDRLFLVEGRSANNVLVCSNGVDLRLFPFEPDYRYPVIVFIGNMTTLQNLDACHYFIDEVMPLLLNLRPYIFRIVGKIQPKDAKRLSSFANVEVTGKVDDISTAVKGASVAICPMRIAAGVQNKILEYMALGLPTVTSSIGFEGLEAQAGEDLLIADEPAEYVMSIEKIIGNVDFAKNLARRARLYVERDHSWESKIAPMTERIHALLG